MITMRDKRRSWIDHSMQPQPAQLGTVFISKRGRGNGVPPDLARVLDGRLEAHLVDDARTFPKIWDFYLIRAGLTAAAEWAAAQCQAQIIVMPQQRDWFATEVFKLAETQSEIWIFTPGRAGELPPNLPPAR